jgi:2-polyprenyl-3-methyl-5-hydroxy-6-metoxy-1,4-benzoquinol methylase
MAQTIEDDYSVPWELLGAGAHRVDATMNVIDPWYRLRMERTLSCIAFPKEQAIKVLDLGCGVGLYDFALARRWSRAHIVGVDINPEQIEFARGKAYELGFADRLKFECADISDWEPRVTYDIVLLTDVVEHFENPNGCLTAARAALSAGGQVIVSVPHTSSTRKDWWFYRQLLADGSFVMAETVEELDPTQPVLRFWHKEFTRDELIGLLIRNGLQVTRSMLCRFDYRYLRRRCIPQSRWLLDLFSDGSQTLRPVLDRIACRVMPRWAKTCIVVARRAA